MKNRMILFLLVMVLIAAVFAGYRYIDQARTDSVGPEITIQEGILEVSVMDEESVLLQGVTAWDDRDGDVTGSILVESVFGIDKDRCTTVTYAAFDSAGNVSKTQRSICLKDYSAPRFFSERSLAVPVHLGQRVMNYIGATDVIDGDIRRHVRAVMISTGSLSQPGSYEIELQVTNSLGDSAKILLPVEIYSDDAYNAELELNQYVVYLERGSKFRAEDYLKQLTYYDERVDLRSGIPENVACEITGTVLPNSAGVYSVRYRVTLTENDREFTGYSMLVVVIV